MLGHLIDLLCLMKDVEKMEVVSLSKNIIS